MILRDNLLKSALSIYPFLVWKIKEKVLILVFQTTIGQLDQWQIQLEKTFSGCKMQGLCDDGNRVEDCPSEPNMRQRLPFLRVLRPVSKDLLLDTFYIIRCTVYRVGVQFYIISWKPWVPRPCTNIRDWSILWTRDKYQKPGGGLSFNILP